MTISIDRRTALNSTFAHRGAGLLLGLLSLHAPAVSAQSSAVVAREQFSVDGMHSTIGFVAKIVGFVKVRGRFRNYDVELTYDSAHVERSSVTAVIASKSIDTDMDFRDNHLRSPDFFNTAAFPTIEFHSERVTSVGPGRLRVSGQLTMHGITRPIAFLARLSTLPRLGDNGSDGLELEASLRLSRKAFGIAGTNKFNPDYNPATNLLSDSADVTLELDMQREGYLDRTIGDLARSLGGGAPPGVVDTISRVLQAHGIMAAADLYHTLRSGQPPAYNFGVGQLDLLGHVLVVHGRLNEALAIFRLNADAYPASDLALEGLGLAQALAGDRSGALATYRHAAEIEPLSASAKEMIRRLSADEPGMARPL
jgi:polyisoprenoid-binding protein YceI